MKKEDVQKLNHGLYVIHWKKKSGGGTSLASVGSLRDGSRWFAPTNWISEGKAFGKHWKSVKKAIQVK